MSDVPTVLKSGILRRPEIDTVGMLILCNKIGHLTLVVAQRV
jgi:hypothetical protein